MPGKPGENELNTDALNGQVLNDESGLMDQGSLTNSENFGQSLKNSLLLNKEKLVVITLLIASFVIGFSFALLRKIPVSATHINDTPVKVLNQSTAKVKVDPSCPIKAKRKKAGKLVYHLPGDQFYARLKATDCFTTEDQARKAGFVKSGR